MTDARIGGRGLIDRLLSVAADLVEDSPRLRHEVGVEVQAKARGKVRHKTGRLAESITLVDTGAAVHVFTDERYAWPVHAGVPREHMAPNRFLLPLAYELDPTPVWERVARDLLGD